MCVYAQDWGHRWGIFPVFTEKSSPWSKIQVNVSAFYHFSSGWWDAGFGDDSDRLGGVFSFFFFFFPTSIEQQGPSGAGVMNYFQLISRLHVWLSAWRLGEVSPICGMKLAKWYCPYCHLLLLIIFNKAPVTTGQFNLSHTCFSIHCTDAPTIPRWCVFLL